MMPHRRGKRCPGNGLVSIGYQETFLQPPIQEIYFRLFIREDIASEV